MSIVRRFSFVRVLCVVAFAVVIASCARPKSDNIVAFANATSALSAFAKSAADLDIEIDGKVRATAAANAYSAGAPNFFPKSGVLIRGRSDADWKAVGAFLDAVGAYADALAKANDPSLVTGLTDKVSNVATALAKIAAAREAATGAGPQTSKRIGLIGGIATDLVGIATNLYAAIQIRSAMEESQPILNDARAPLQSALRIIVADARSKLEDYRTGLECKLHIARGKYDPYGCPKLAREAAIPAAQATSIAQHDAFIAASQEYLLLQARLQALRGLDGAIEKMIAGHQKLKDNLDDTAALKQFLEAVGSIADKLAQLEAIRQTAKR